MGDQTSWRSSEWLMMLVLLVAVFVDGLSYSIVIPILPLYMEQLNVSEGWIGFLFGIFSAAYMIAAVAGVPVIRKFGKKGCMISSVVILELSTLLFAFGTSYVVLFFARFLQGLSSGSMWTAALSMIADYFPNEKQGSVYSYVNISMGILLGPIIGGFMMDQFDNNKEYPFMLVICIGLFDLVGRLVIKDRPSVQDTSEEGWPVLLKDIPLLFLNGSIFVAQGVLTATEPVLPLFYHSKLQLDSFWIGVLVGVPFLTFACLSPLVGRFIDKLPWTRKYCILCGLIILGACFPFIPIFPVIWMQVIFQIVIGVGDILSATPPVPEINHIVETKYASKYTASSSAMVNLFYSSGSFVGPIYSAALVDLLGLTSALVSMAVTIWIFAILFAVFVIFIPRKESEFRLLDSADEIALESSEQNEEE